MLKDAIDVRLDTASKVTIMVYLHYISLAGLEDVNYIPLLITMPVLLMVASSIGQLPEIFTGFMLNIRALVPHACAFSDLSCPKTAVFWFHYETLPGVINFIIILVAIYLYCLVIVLKYDKTSEEITLV